MPTLRVRTAAILAKIETTEGVEIVPSAGTNGVLVENFRATFNPNIIETNENTPSLDPFAPIVGGMSVTLEFDAYLKGAGAAGTPPEYGSLLKACGWQETITATAIPAAPEALAAGASQTTATLGATAVGTAQLYQGMPIIFTGTVPGSSFITSYSAGKVAQLADNLGASLTTSTNYQIPVNVLYAPASQSIPSLTIYWYNDGILYKFIGCRGNTAFNITSGGPGRISFRMMGQLLTKTDAALPSVTYDTTRPPIWKGGALRIGTATAAASQFALDMGSQIVQPDNPNADEGFDPGIITARQPRGSFDPKETLVATRDLMTSFRNQTMARLHARFGITDGNRVGLTVPLALYLNQAPEDRNGYRVTTMPFHASGQDAGAMLCFY